MLVTDTHTHITHHTYTHVHTCAHVDLQAGLSGAGGGAAAWTVSPAGGSVRDGGGGGGNKVSTALVNDAATTEGEGPVGLGSGWRTLLEVLKRGAGDACAPVVARTMAALVLPVEALYQADGNEAASHRWVAVRGMLLCRVGQDRVYTPYMTVYLVISLPRKTYI